MRELSVVEQRYQAVQAVIGEGSTVTEVAARFGVSRQTVHAWLARYEAGGLDALGDGSHRPRGCPHQMPTEVETEIARLRFAHPSWGLRRLVFELGQPGVDPVPGRTSVYRALLRRHGASDHRGPRLLRRRSRRPFAAIVGWSIADHIRSELVVDALQMARWNRHTNPARARTRTGAAFTRRGSSATD